MPTENELMHHGRLGMRWGKRNGPPYPLDYKNLSAEERAQAKDTAIKKGNINEAARNIDYYSNEELRAVRDRFNLNMEISKISASTKKTGAQKVDKAIEWINRARSGGEAAMKAYNFVAKINNSLTDDEEAQLPILGEKKGHKNKAEGKNRKELLELVKSKNLSTQDYIDVANRLKSMGEAEDYFKSDMFNEAMARDMAKNPNKYSNKQISNMANTIKNLNKINNYANGKSDDKDDKDDDLEHSFKGTSWSKDPNKAKYKKKEKLDNGRYRYYYEEAKTYKDMASDLQKLTQDEVNQWHDLANEAAQDAKDSVATRTGVQESRSFWTGKLNKKTVTKKVKVSKEEAVRDAAVKRTTARKNIQELNKNYSSVESLKRMSSSAANAGNKKSKSYKVKATVAYYKNKAASWFRKKKIQKTYAKDAFGWKNRKTGEYVDLGKGFVAKYLT